MPLCECEQNSEERKKTDKHYYVIVNIVQCILLYINVSSSAELTKKNNIQWSHFYATIALNKFTSFYTMSTDCMQLKKLTIFAPKIFW